MLAEEGRLQYGVVDDYELFLGDHGYAGQQFAHGMCNNEYLNRPWHLPEAYHVTNWTTQQMARLIKRRDPNRPGFWYLSYCHPHPPLAPLACYLDMYREIDDFCGDFEPMLNEHLISDGNRKRFRKRTLALSEVMTI
ncbi:MAG: hypothetical protein O7E52_23945, partial [Candidatus Poribacteria bacterium]|nr:hypothetical protein [Candidatus Poribacteria bacterium]